MNTLVLAIPVLNAERFLAETLESLNLQLSHLRWWLQDGGSTDRTLEIARRYARPGDTVTSEADGGQAAALNSAMKQMGGEIVGFINGDDCLTPGAAARVLEYFAAHPEIDLVYGSVEWMNENSKAAGTHTGQIGSLEELLNIYDVWWRKRQWVQPEVFYRRSLWEKAGGFDPKYRLAFDYDFWVRCFLAGARVGHLPEPLARIRLHGGDKSSVSEQTADEIRAIVKERLGRRAPLRGSFRRQLRARLEYDMYANAKSDAGKTRRPSLAAELLRHPYWLLAPEVRSQLGASFRSRGKEAPKR